jgi:hypothetical protein
LWSSGWQFKGLKDPRGLQFEEERADYLKNLALTLLVRLLLLRLFQRCPLVFCGTGTSESNNFFGSG